MPPGAEPADPSLTSFSWKTVYQNSDFRGGLREVELNRVGQYVAVFLPTGGSSTLLTLSEVEVYGFVIEGRTRSYGHMGSHPVHHL